MWSNEDLEQPEINKWKVLKVFICPMLCFSQFSLASELLTLSAPAIPASQIVLPQATGPLHKLFPLSRTPSLYLIDCKLPCRSWLNCQFLTKALMGLQSLLVYELWARIPESECLGLNSSSSHTVYMTFLCLCFLILKMEKVMIPSSESDNSSQIRSFYVQCLAWHLEDSESSIYCSGSYHFTSIFRSIVFLNYLIVTK